MTKECKHEDVGPYEWACCDCGEWMFAELPDDVTPWHRKQLNLKDAIIIQAEEELDLKDAITVRLEHSNDLRQRIIDGHGDILRSQKLMWFFLGMSAVGVLHVLEWILS